MQLENINNKAMNFLDLAQSRYTTKKYDVKKKIAEEKVQQLKEILRLSPSSINSQPWKFIFVSDEKIKRKLADASSFNGQKINEASHLVVFCSINNIEKFEEQIRANISQSAQEYYNEILKPLSDFEIKAWLNHQVYLSLGFFLSACAGLEIDSTTMEGINNKEYDKILNLTDYTTLFAVALGYRDEEDTNQLKFKPKARLPIAEIIQTI